MLAKLLRTWVATSVFGLAATWVPSFAISEPASTVGAPEPPRLRVDTRIVPASGKTIVVAKGGNFQAALNAAKPGDVITLEAGATYVGPFTLPAKPGSGWIVVHSSAPESRDPPPAARRWDPAGARDAAAPRGLPPPGHRVDPSYADLMPKLVARSAPVISAASGAHHYRFIGIEIRPDGNGIPSVAQMLRAIRGWFKGGEAFAATIGYSDLTLVRLGAKETSTETLPHHIIFDRCYLHGDPKGGARRGIAMNSRDTAVIDSYLSDFKAVGVDSQAILGWNGPGPFKIVNNYLEGAGENVMFGGGTPMIADLVPSDIEIRGNHFAKPLSWKIDHPSYEGTPWTIKNLFELKNARRVWIEGNLFEHSWAHAQDGFAVLLTVRTEDDAVPWAVVEDVTIANNVIRRSASGINLMGVDDGSARRNGRARRIAILNNLFEQIGGADWGGGGRLFQLLDATEHVTIEHNTALHAGTIVFGERAPHRDFVFTHNIVSHNEYGVIGSGTGVGAPTLERYFPGAVVTKNVIVGGPPQAYPAGNFFPATIEDVGFANRALGDYRLKRSSPYVRAANRAGAIGVDFDALAAAMEPGWIEASQRETEEKQPWASAPQQSRNR